MDFVITHKKLFITRNYMLRIIASFENEMKHKVIMHNVQLNETAKQPYKGYFLQCINLWKQAQQEVRQHWFIVW